MDGRPPRRYRLSDLVSTIALRPNPQPAHRDHINVFPAHLSGQDFAGLHHKWTLPLQRRVLDYEHIPPIRYCSLPGQRHPATKRRRAARMPAPPPNLTQRHTSIG